MDMQKLIILRLKEHEVFLKRVLNFNEKFKLYEIHCPHTNNSSALKMDVGHFFKTPVLFWYTYSKSQQVALFLKFILVKNSTCFRQIYCPSSGVLILYSQQYVFVILKF